MFGLILAAVIGFIFLGGVNRLASVVEKIVPIMAGIYIVGKFSPDSHEHYGASGSN